MARDAATSLARHAALPTEAPRAFYRSTLPHRWPQPPGLAALTAQYAAHPAHHHVRLVDVPYGEWHSSRVTVRLQVRFLQLAQGTATAVSSLV